MSVVLMFLCLIVVLFSFRGLGPNDSGPNTNFGWRLATFLRVSAPKEF